MGCINIYLIFFVLDEGINKKDYYKFNINIIKGKKLKNKENGI